MLERNIGRYVHIGMILPKVHHFLGRLRALQRRAKNRRRIKIPSTCVEDLKLMRRFISCAKQGIDMNLLTYRLPNWVHRGDSCPIGMGGYTHRGDAWRWYIPKELQNRASNNLLEHLANIIGPWIDILKGKLQRGDCILSMTDSTTSAGWISKSNFNGDPELTSPDEEEDPIHADVRREVCRKHAEMMMDEGICEYSQWFEGGKNNIADSLSRDDNVPDEKLTHLLKTHYPEQAPKDLKIAPLPKEISSWLTSLLQRLPERKQSQEQHMRTKIGLGEDGATTSKTWDSKTTTTSTASPQNNELKSSAPLPKHSEKGDFLAQLSTPWLLEQSRIPSHLWYRPSGTSSVHKESGVSFGITVKGMRR